VCIFQSKESVSLLGCGCLSQGVSPSKFVCLSVSVFLSHPLLLSLFQCLSLSLFFCVSLIV